jgi:hydroxylamine reductase (hybrid-cluster protein)
MEDGQVKNILCESYGLPHDCQERKDAKKAEWEAIKKEKRDQYYSEKNLLEELVKTNRISQKECNQQLYRCRRNIWPSLFAKK